MVSLKLFLVISLRVTQLCHGLRTSMPPMTKFARHIPLAKEAMKYFDESTDPFHTVQSSIQMLVKAGFEHLEDVDPYSGKVKPGGKYYFTRNRSTIVAFAVGKKYETGKGGFKVIGGHTDTPNLKVKPRSKRHGGKSPGSSIQIGVETYGGGLWHTWFDRDLGISGRVFCRSEKSGGGIQQRLIQIRRPLLRISNLAIHLTTPEERKAFSFNKEDHLSPILAMAAQKSLDGDSGVDENTKEEKEEKDGWTEHQEPLLVQLIADELDIKPEDIVDFELNLFDIQKAALGGFHSEFVTSSRLDNQATCYLATEALVQYVQDEENFLENDTDINMVVLYDHEEIGSASAIGAASPILGEAVKRVSSALASDNASDMDMFGATTRRSFVLSCDQAHAVHPNYATKHEKDHQPIMNGGIVIKRNSNQRYATNGVTGTIIREVARRASLPSVQEFIVRNDCACGSTIGPLISTATGIRAVDMGCPQLSMHSIRETMGICDLTSGLEVFKAFFQHFREVDDSIEQ